MNIQSVIKNHSDYHFNSNNYDNIIELHDIVLQTINTDFNIILDTLIEYNMIEYYVIVIYVLLFKNDLDKIVIILNRIHTNELYCNEFDYGFNGILQTQIDNKDIKYKIIKMLSYLYDILNNNILHNDKIILNKIFDYIKLSNYNYAALYYQYNLNESISEFIIRLNIKPTISFYIEVLNNIYSYRDNLHFNIDNDIDILIKMINKKKITEKLFNNITKYRSGEFNNRLWYDLMMYNIFGKDEIILLYKNNFFEFYKIIDDRLYRKISSYYINFNKFKLDVISFNSYKTEIKNFNDNIEFYNRMNKIKKLIK